MKSKLINHLQVVFYYFLPFFVEAVTDSGEIREFLHMGNIFYNKISFGNLICSTNTNIKV